jgi:activator of HSP90 ATPase
MAHRVKTIRQKIFLPSVVPADVYDAFVSAKRHAAFTGSPATGAARVGGRFHAFDGYVSGVHRELVKGRKVVQDWQTTEWPSDARPSTLQLSFKKVKGGTELRMVHSNVPAEQADGYRQGWIDYYWTPLKTYFSPR